MKFEAKSPKNVKYPEYFAKNQWGIVSAIKEKFVSYLKVCIENNLTWIFDPNINIKFINDYNFKNVITQVILKSKIIFYSIAVFTKFKCLISEMIYGAKSKENFFFLHDLMRNNLLLYSYMISFIICLSFSLLFEYIYLFYIFLKLSTDFKGMQ